MTIRTITEPTADMQKIKIYNTRMKASSVKVLELDRKYAVCLVSLAAGVTQPDDYAALKVAIEDVTGVQQIELLIDGQCPSEIPAGKELRMTCEAHLRIDDAPEE